MNKFGVGLVDYFRLLKFNLLFYFILAVFGFLTLYSCGENLSKIDDISKIFHFSNIRDFLAKFTLGNSMSKDYYKCIVDDIRNKTSINIQCDYYPKSNYFYLIKDSLAIFETSDENETAPYDSICNNYVNNKRYESPFTSKEMLDINKIKKNTKCNDRHSLCEINLDKIKDDLKSMIFIAISIFLIVALLNLFFSSVFFLLLFILFIFYI